MKALNNDYEEILNKTVGEGIHTGIMGGVVLMTLKCYAGMNFDSDPVSISPCLPDKWQEISFSFILRQRRYNLQIRRDRIRILVNSAGENFTKVMIRKEEYIIKAGKWVDIKLSN